MMRRSTGLAWLLTALCVMSTGISTSGASAQAAAQHWQSSYDREATGDIPGALTAMRAIPERQRGTLWELRRGWLFYTGARYDESIASYRRAVGAAPRAVEPRLGLLLPLMALRRWQEAEQVAQEALRIDRDNHLAGRRLALALYSLGRFDDAQTVYRRMLALHPSDLEMREGLGWCAMRMNRMADARRHFQAVLSIAPNSAGAQAGLAASES